MTTDDYIKYDVDSTNQREERIEWVKPIKDCTTAVNNLDRSAVELGKAIREGIQKQIDGDKNVNHPSHYCDGKIEVIDFIEDKKLGYHLGNVIKYVSRAGKKDAGRTIEDLKKARWYLDRYIEKLEGR